MIKAQDCMILLKLLAKPGKIWSQRELAQELYISLSEINAGLRRLIKSSLARKMVSNGVEHIVPISSAAEEFVVVAIKYIFPGKLEEYTRGIPTAIGAPIFKKQFVLGDDPIPVWPDVRGKIKGVALKPVHPSIPKSLRDYPDESFYKLAVLVDTIRVGRIREKQIAIKLLKEAIRGESEH